VTRSSFRLLQQRAPLARRCGLSAFAMLALAACAVGPDYRRPSVELPASWTTEEPWRAAQPDDAALRGNWWEMFSDARLDALETDALAHNQNLAVAGEHLAQARAVAAASSAALFPQLDAGAGASRERISANRPLANYTVPNSSTVQTDLTPNFSVHYEADLFGGVRRQVEAARAAQEQAQADLENARLVLEAELAADYFNLRELDAEIDIVRQNIVAQRHALEFVRHRHDMGLASGLDLAQAQSQLDTTTTQVDLLRVQRAQFEHAIATLVARPAPGFALEPAAASFAVPPVPVGLPSNILQRRPDVASAERAMAAANARIGVAKAAFFPSIALGGVYGRESNQLGNLFGAASTLWALGVSATQVLFDAGRLSANADFARSDYQAAVDSYRQTVLTAMQEVQDGMSGTVYLARAAGEADAAVKSATRVSDIANDRYVGGLATYLDVITAEQALLANQRQQVQINGQKLLVTVYLVKALGGGWKAVTPPLAQASSNASVDP
jgi:NodT family efflux transporter outer membrane factor (OMF) lipoprotein